jgi:two-component system osmolarity sensor histidine kinase EnvZ
MRLTSSLIQQNALRLIVVFVVFELLLATAVIQLLMLPMARQAASDVAGLMILSAQTWSELPPETRPAFTRALADSHQLILSTREPDGATPIDWHGPYAEQLEESIAQRTGVPVVLASSTRDGETWNWVALPSGDRKLWLGFSRSRVGTQPAAAALFTLVAGVVFAVVAAIWLARRTVAPLERFGSAAASLGRGETPDLLPETGPRELAALAKQFNGLTRQVRELLEARTTLLVGLSHDLRTPLARMRLALEMLQSRPEPVWMERLDRDIGEMNQLVADVLELARGLGQEKPANVDIGELLDELTRHAREAGAEVTITGERPVVRAPVRALRRLLGNLLDNAQRHGGGTAIEMTVIAAENTWRIGVLDHGPGIPADQIEAVFQPFHRVDVSRNRATGGTGLGLAIVRQLAQANGWRVALENRPHGGLAAWVGLTA